MISGALLVAVLALLFVVMWRDYRSAVVQVEASRRAYGRLVELREIDDGYVADRADLSAAAADQPRSLADQHHPDHDDYASGEHALVALRSGQWWLEDRQSRNGTMINGMPITQPVIITDGDIIGVGSVSLSPRTGAVSDGFGFARRESAGHCRQSGLGRGDGAPVQPGRRAGRRSTAGA